MIVAATGMRREARIIQGPGVVAIVRGNDPEKFQRKLEHAIHEGAHGVISIGIAGALNPTLRTGDVLIGTAVVVPHPNSLSPIGGEGQDEGVLIETDAAWRARLAARLSTAKLATIAAADRIVLTPRVKATFREATKADAVDLESGIAAMLARAHGLPFSILRVISDEAGTELPAAVQVALDSEGGVNGGALSRSLVMRPSQLAALTRAASDSRAALRCLLGCLDLIGPGLAGPDLG